MHSVNRLSRHKAALPVGRTLSWLFPGRQHLPGMPVLPAATLIASVPALRDLPRGYLVQASLYYFALVFINLGEIH